MTELNSQNIESQRNFTTFNDEDILMKPIITIKEFKKMKLNHKRYYKKYYHGKALPQVTVQKKVIDRQNCSAIVFSIIFISFVAAFIPLGILFPSYQIIFPIGIIFGVVFYVCYLYWCFVALPDPRIRRIDEHMKFLQKSKKKHFGLYLSHFFQTEQNQNEKQVRINNKIPGFFLKTLNVTKGIQFFANFPREKQVLLDLKYSFVCEDMQILLQIDKQLKKSEIKYSDYFIGIGIEDDKDNMEQKFKEMRKSCGNHVCCKDFRTFVAVFMTLIGLGFFPLILKYCFLVPVYEVKIILKVKQYR